MDDTKRKELLAAAALPDEALDAASGGAGVHTYEESGTEQSDSDGIVAKGPISLEVAEPVRVVLDDSSIVKILADGR